MHIPDKINISNWNIPQYSVTESLPKTSVVTSHNLPTEQCGKLRITLLLVSCFIACTLLPALRSRFHKISTQLFFLHSEVGFYNIPAHWPGSDTLSEAHHPTKLYINPPSLPLQALFSRFSLLPLLVSVWPAGMIAQISPSYLNCHWWAEELTSLASTHSAQHFTFLLFQRWAEG